MKEDCFVAFEECGYEGAYHELCEGIKSISK